MANFILRLEQPDNFATVDRITYEAFKGAPHGDGNEALLAHKLRTCAAFVPELDFVAELNGQVVGNILYSKSKIVADSGEEWETLTFGPLSVRPNCQRQGVGSALVRHTTELARQMGFRAVLIFGHESYYPRFGFVPAARFGVTTADGQNFDAFMALPLYDGALDGVHGRYFIDAVYEDLGKAESDEFNRRFIE
jgi:predicted N-acetyltransferase YhbS